MPTAKIGRRGQTTIPREVREWTGLAEGDRVAFVRRGDEVVLVPLRETLLSKRGSVPVSERQDFERIRSAVLADRVGERARVALGGSAGAAPRGRQEQVADDA